MIARKILLFILIMCGAQNIFATDLTGLDGYTIVATKTIEGWYDENGEKGDDFQGCDYNRIIIFDDNTRLACGEYSYTYAYRPEAVILFNGSQIKMIVDDETYDMSK